MRRISIATLAVFGLALAGCNTTASTQPNVLKQAVQDAANLTPQQKYEIACQSVDALHLAYMAFLAKDQSAGVNARVEASYAAAQAICSVRPENYATALVAVIQSVNSFKAALPKAA